MNKAVSCVLLGVAVAAASVLAGCTSDGGDSNYTLDGEVTDNNTSGGERAYIKLVAPGAGEGAAAIYWTVSTGFGAVSHIATYSISGIAEGTYDRYIFVDLDNDSVAGAGAAPDTGDDGTGSGSFTFPPDSVDVLLGGIGTWTPMP